MAMRRLRGVPCSNDTTAFPLSGPWPGTRGYMLHLMDSGVAEFLRKLVWNHSLLDVGAGTGMYGAHFHSLRADPSRGSQKVDAPAWVGFDGSPDVENFTRTKGPPGSLTLQADLCDPSLTLPTLDWAMSLEVGEHLPTHCLANYLRLLDAGNRRGLFLSWAVPGQSGHCHINTRAPAVVVATLAVLGYDFAVNDTLRARSEANTNSVQEHAHGVPPRRPPLLRLTQAPAEPRRRLPACQCHRRGLEGVHGLCPNTGPQRAREDAHRKARQIQSTFNQLGGGEGASCSSTKKTGKHVMIDQKTKEPYAQALAWRHRQASRTTVSERRDVVGTALELLLDVACCPFKLCMP